MHIVYSKYVKVMLMKKLFLILTILVLLSTFMWGCSQNADNGSSEFDPIIPPDNVELPDADDVIPPDIVDPEPDEVPDVDETPDDETVAPTPTPTPPPTPTPTKEYVSYIHSNTDRLSIRLGAGTNYAIIGYLDKKDMVIYKGVKNGWYQTVYKDRVAYVSSSYSSVLKIEKASTAIENILEKGYGLLGYPYVWGSQRFHWGNGVLNTAYIHGEYDCSAFTQYVFYKGGKILLDVNTRTQVTQGTPVNGSLKRGDVMFFTNSSRVNLSGVNRVGHVAIYLGDNYIMHTASDVAVIEPISSKRWEYYILSKRFV